MLSAHFVGMAAWQTSGKSRSEEDRNCQAQMDWEKYVCVLAHTQNIDNNIFFQHAEAVVTVCQSLNFVRYCLCLGSLNSLFLPFKAFVLASWCFCLSVIASPCLLKAAFVVCFFTHDFTFFLSQ